MSSFSELYSKILLDHLIILLYKRSGNVVYNSTSAFSTSVLHSEEDRRTEEEDQTDEEQLKEERLKMRL